ncbi:TPA: ABC-three component system protein [Enterobacter soli]
MPYCYLQDVEEKTKSKIETYLLSEKLPCSDFLVNLKFEALQSHIAAQVIYIHACNQDGLMSAAEAAFTQTLKSEKIVELLSLTATHEDDIVYKMFQARMAVCKSLYGYANTMEKTADRTVIQKVANVYDQIKELGDTQFIWLWKSLCFGSSTMVVSENSVYDYVDVIYDIDKAPLSEQKPPYYRCSAGDFYLPTAISADNVRREHRFAEDLMEQLKCDPELIDILVEYQWLIAARANIFSPAERFCAATGVSRDAVEDEFSLMGKDRNKITKAFDAKIISKEEARVKLND